MPSDFSLHLNMDELQPEKFYSLGLVEKLKHHKHQVSLFARYLVAAVIILGCLSFFGSSHLVKLIQVGGFAALGYLHLTSLKGTLSSLNDKQQAAYSALLAVAIFLLLSLLLLIISHFQIAIAIGAACAFLLPYAVEEVWQAFTLLPTGGEAVPWYYSENMPLKQSTVFLNSIPIKFKVQANGGELERNIAFRAPVRMRLGLIFYHMIKEQNDNGRTPIDLADTKSNPYGWVFFSPNLFGSNKYLNPEATLIENGIKQNRLIIARQIDVKALPEPPNQTKKRTNKTI